MFCRPLVSSRLVILGGWGLALSLGCLVWLPASARGATKRERGLAAEASVRQALTGEARGYEATDRAASLAAALEQVPNYAPAMWHSGQVQWGKKWVPASQVPQLVGEDPRYQAYLKVRERYESTEQGQWELARWCGKHGLPDQQRAHLTKILELNPENVAARNALGFERVDGVWIDPKEVAAGNERAQELAENLQAWRPKCQQILKGLQHSSQHRRVVAERQFQEIRDSAAIPALEATFAAQDEPIAMLLIKTLARIEGYQSSLALARQAVMSPWAEVQQAATDELKERPKDAYVPELLAALYSPVQSRAELYAGPRGRLMYRHVIFREGQQFNELAVLETGYRRRAVEGGDRIGTVNRALNLANDQYQEREQMIERQNALTQELNSRVCSVLSRATGESLPQEPEAWWSWWNEYNEVFLVDVKPTRQLFASQEITLTDDLLSSDGLDGGSESSGPPPSMPLDCLARGTLVQTATGTTAIEAVQVGDLVLSQDIETGELAYKPVLRTTIRPVSNLVVIHAAGQTLTASGGHLFWVSGKGWVKARELKAGDQLHHATGTVDVVSVDDGPRDQTYNLIVADFHTYFAGADRILSHDNTIHERTDLVVPGLAKGE